MTLPAAPRNFAEAQSVLAEKLPGYETRAPQAALASFIESIINTPTSLDDEVKPMGIAQASTGTGKSLGGLIPAITSGKRTVLATATIALQRQYAAKDLPFLQETLGVPFKWALLKGRSNFVCLAKVNDPENSLDESILSDLKAEIAREDHSGDYEDLETKMPKSMFSHVSSTSDECPGKNACPFGEQCFAEFAKKKAAEADVVVTNTAMLMTDAKVRQVSHGAGSMLGAWDLLIVDECHRLEEATTNQFSERFTLAGALKAIKDADGFAIRNGAEIPSELVERAENAVRSFWRDVPAPKPSERTRVFQSDFLAMGPAIMEISESFSELCDHVVKVDPQAGRGTAARRDRIISALRGAADRYLKLATEGDNVRVRWIEWESSHRGDFLTVMSAPIEAGPILRELLWSQAPSICMSATIAQGSSFDFAMESMGMQGADTIDVGTPFDYDSQALLYVPERSIPSPKERSAWMSWSQFTMVEMVKKSGGGAMLLFTSRPAMEQAFRMMAPQIEGEGYRCLMQGGDLSNKDLVEEFKSDVDSCLFGLKTFFEGVDVPGDACRLVIIDKLPFPVPTDPIFAARSDLIQKRGGSSFTDLSIPLMTLTLEQAFGRLIRHREDRGVVAILDSRLSSSQWGRRIVGDLPDCPVTTSMADVERFFRQ